LEYWLPTKMDKKVLEKNTLDLSYKRNLQILNAILFIGVGSFITYLAALILNSDKIIQYTIILAVIATVTYLMYTKINQTLKEISQEIKKLYK